MKTIANRVLSALLSLVTVLCLLSPVGAFAASESELRSKVIDIASAEVGYEGSSSYSKYGDWYGYQGGWCTTFVLWCCNQAGEAYDVKIYANIVPSGGNCNSMISWFSNKGRYHEASSGYSPKKGDLVFFDWSGNGSSQHVGFVKSTSGSTVYTVEGNCSGKVKARKYTSNGSKPYNNISAIMGYGEPDYAKLASGKSDGTTKKKTTAKATTAATTKQTTAATTSKQTTGQNTTAATTQSSSTTTTTTATTTTTTTTTKPTTEAVPLEKLEIYASTYDLQLGDSVKLEYSVKPASAPAVVGYFCDDEGIIEIGTGGNIKAIGTGKATVVVCANDDLYAQCDFEVTEAVGDVTLVAENTSRKVVGTAVSEMTTQPQDTESFLTKLGINVNQLSQNPQLYAYPAAIAGSTLIISLFIYIIKRFRKK